MHEQTEETHKKLLQDNLPFSQYLNQEPPKHEAGVTSTTL